MRPTRRCSPPSPRSTRLRRGPTRASTRRSTSTTCRSPTWRRCGTGRATRPSASRSSSSTTASSASVLFELTDSRVMLLLFPNTFEFFFIAYELVRLRNEPSRFSARFWLFVGAGLWVFVKLPAGVLDPHRQARLHRHGPRPSGVRRRDRARAAGRGGRARPRRVTRGSLLPSGDGDSPPTGCRRRSSRRTRATRAGSERSRADARGGRAGVPARRCCASSSPRSCRAIDATFLAGRRRRRGDRPRQRRDQPRGRAPRRLRARRRRPPATRRCS